MTPPRPLWIYTSEWAALPLDRIREAKVSLGLDYRVVPEPAAIGGGFDRVLAVEWRPPFLCDYAFVTSSTPVPALADAIAWALGEREDARAMTLEDMLTVILGPGVREISAEEQASEERLRAYQRGEA